MSEPYLEVTYRHGRPIAAYYYLPRASGAVSSRTERAEAGLLIDYDESGDAIGIEITAPGEASLERLNMVLDMLDQAPISADDIAPLHAA